MMYDMDVFEEFLRSLSCYTEDEILEMKGHYAVAKLTPDHDKITQSFISAVKVCIRGCDEYLDPSKLMSREKDLTHLKISTEAAARGLLVLRSIFARVVVDFRKRTNPNPPEHVVKFNSDGYTIIENFLGRSRLADAIADNIGKFPIFVNKNESNIIDNSDALGNYPLHEFMWNMRLREYLFDCLMLPSDHKDASAQFRENTFVQRVHNIPGDGDIQKTMHMDTYFDAMKFWYFPKEVKLENGPFNFSPHSQLLSIGRLKWMQSQYMKWYRNDMEPEKLPWSGEGSLRIFPQELNDINLSVKPMNVPGDTLVIANVFGFHGRGEATVESIRDAVHGSIRLKMPFEPSSYQW